MNSIDLTRKAIVVTGGTHGIGAAVVEIALQSGALVTLCARTRTDVHAAIDAFASKGDGDRVHGVVADVSRPEDVGSLFAEATSRFGPIDGVVHAAAVIGPIGRAGDLDPTAWWDAVRVDLFGSYLVIAEACRRMDGRGGRIVAFSGGGATMPFANYSAYAASKAAVVRLVESIALEYREAGIALNAVAPGFVATRMHDATLAAGAAAGAEYLERTRREIGAGGSPPELGARCACFLLSDEARGINGRIISAVWDDWETLPSRIDEIADTDAFTLRRIVPRDRGHDWQ